MRDHWTFFKGATEFHCIDAALNLASMAPDTLTLVRPSITLTQSDVVSVKFHGVVKFIGKIIPLAPERRGGTSTTNTYQAVNCWDTLQNEIYTQDWATYVAGELVVYRHSRVVLNQAKTGAPMALATQVADILAAAVSIGVLQVGTITVPAVYLPYDGQRCITLEVALQRCLRFFPLVYTWFDYSTTPPTINMGSGAAATWMDLETLRATSIIEKVNGLPLDGVILDLEEVGDNNGAPYIKYTQQAAGTVTAGSRVMRIPLDLKGNSGSSTMRSLDVEVEAIPADWTTNKTWWKSKHPRLANVTTDEMTLSDAARVGDHVYPNISINPIQDLTAAGLSACMSTFTVKCTIKKYVSSVVIDEEELILLTMDFVTTSAETKKYSWLESSTLALGEWIPTGLAAALLAQHAHDGEETTIVYRPEQTFWALPGQTYDGLICSSVSISLLSDLATAVFAPQTALSAQDLAGLMTGWRNNGGGGGSYSRATAEPPANARTDDKPIAPTQTTEFSPGSKKTVGAKNDNSTAVMSSDDLATGEAAKFREFTFAVDPATGTARKIKVLATEGTAEIITIPGGGAWDGTAPSGYEWITLNFVTDGKIITLKVLCHTATKADVATWTSSDSRLLLQCNTSGVLRLDKGYLKS